MARAKNTYIKDLNLGTIGNVDSFRMDSEFNEGTYFLCRLARIGQDEFLIQDIETDLPELKELISRRYENESYDKETVNIRLRDMQYEVRKAFAANGKEEEETPKNEDKMEHEILRGQEAIEAIKEDFVDVAPKEEKPKKVRKTPKVGLEAQIFNLVWEAVESDEAAENIKKTVKNQLDEWGIVPGRTDVHIKMEDMPAVNMGTQHKEFKTVLQALKAKCNLALVGPAGSGKTTVVKESAKLLELPFYSKSVSSQTTVYEIFGYKDANGQYQRTLFREAYENGGVFLLDEFDAGNPNVLASMNAATANGDCAFPDKMVEKHDDFIVVMAGNTYGHGATSEYVGRNKIDAATLDRFVYVFFDYDQDFEYQLATNKEWCLEVQAIREVVAQKKIKAIVSPRATFEGAKLLAVGMSKEKVKQMTIYKGLSKDEVAMIKAAV